MKYKVGDKVKVRSDLKCEEYYDGVPFTSEMNRFKGMEITIEKVNYGGYYEVLETPYNFTDEMLEPVEEMSAEEAISFAEQNMQRKQLHYLPDSKKFQIAETVKNI